MRVQFIDEELKKFIWGLERATRAKVFHTIELLGRFGNLLGMPRSKAIGRGLYELRIRGKVDIRIFYVFRDKQAILLHGFIKKSQHLPSQELARARQKMRLVDNV